VAIVAQRGGELADVAAQIRAAGAQTLPSRECCERDGVLHEKRTRKLRLSF
jgi:hypothetical protein